MCNINIVRCLPLLFAGFSLLSFAGLVLAEEGCQQSSPTPADTVALIDATTGCAAVNQFGCRIEDGEGGCMATDPENSSRKFKVTSIIDSVTGLANWSLSEKDTETTIKVDTALYGGASGGGACAQLFEPDVDAGSGGYIKSNTNTSNITYLYVCSDGEDEFQDSATAFEGFRSCVENNAMGGEGILDGSTVRCPQQALDGSGSYPRSLVCNFEVDAEDQGTCEPGEEGCNAISSDFCCYCNFTDDDIAAQEACDTSVNPDDCPIHEIKTGKEVGITIFDGSTCGWMLVGGRKKWACTR